MNIRNRHWRAARTGFTLMELLLVMAILVMLLAFVVPRFMNTSAEADIKAAKIQIGLLKGSLELYQQNMKTFPTTEQGLIALVEEPADLEGKGKWSAVSDRIPKDPWDNDYQYRFPPEHNKDIPDIWSMGPDGEDGTEDDIVNWQTEEETEDLASSR